MIKYIGSKRKLVNNITDIIGEQDVNTVFDVFSGAGHVGVALKKKGYRVISNDYAKYAQIIARCYVETSDGDNYSKEAESYLVELNKVEPKSGYFTETFCISSRFFTPENGAIIDAMREKILNDKLHPKTESIVLTSLMEAADRVDSTCGIQMAYLKEYATRALKPIELRMPLRIAESEHGEAIALCDYADAAVGRSPIEYDLAYLDPPYNQHSYIGNYHIWESLVVWDKPPHYGIACKRTEVRTKKSNFNFKKKIAGELVKVISNLRCSKLLLSFSNEGYIPIEDMISLLGNHGKVTVSSVDYVRYIGAKIGIHNEKGDKVGKVSHTVNKEFFFFVESHGKDFSVKSRQLDIKLK